MKIRTPRLTFALLGALLAAPAFAQQTPACPYYENRSGLCGYYHSEISPAAAYLDTVVKSGHAGHGPRHPHARAVILDVRSTPEYKAGHPEHAFNVPYPYVYQYCDAQGRSPDGACLKKTSEIAQDPVAFVEHVKKLFPNKSTPIYVLCRTGVRSVGAANLLTDAGYTQVRNIWEGFWGVKLTAPKVQADGSVRTVPVDLNHDGVVNDLDNNGWRNHQGLPYDTRLLPHLIYRPAAETYTWAN